MICLIFNKGAQEDVASNRPVSLTSVVRKVFKRIIKSTRLFFLSVCNAITDCQNTILPIGPFICNFTLLKEMVTRFMDNGDTSDAVYLDFAKACNSVNHGLLLVRVKKASDGLDHTWQEEQ